MIIVDTGFLVAAAVETETHHAACAATLDRLRRDKEVMLLPATVAAETGYMLFHEAGEWAEIKFLTAVSKKEFQPVELLTDDYIRMTELATQYVNFPLGTTDASIIAIAERLQIDTIATIDRRHFTAVRPNHIPAFNLLPAKL